MDRVEGGGRGVGDEKQEAMDPEPVLGRALGLAQGDADGESVCVVVGGNVQVVEAGNDRIRWVGSSQVAGDHNFHTGSEEVEVRTWQAGRAVGCDNGVKGEVAAAAQCAHTSNCYDGRIVSDRVAVESE